MNRFTWQNKTVARLGIFLVGFVLPSQLLAVSPAPDGGYAGNNTAEGTSALFSLTSGIDNTGLGFQALFHNTTGGYNTAEGFRALFSNTNGLQNTANGVNTLALNTTGKYNTADGANALYHNSAGNYNTGVGVQALFNATASNNTAVGFQALYNNTNGFANTANGVNALLHDTTGFNNTAIGASALASNIAGVQNTAVGVNALVGSTGSNNTAVGLGAGENATSGDGNVYIGALVDGVAGESNTTRVRNIYSSIANGRVVYINSDSKIGTLSSSRRYKEEIKLMDKASETLFALRPVTFRYKKDVDAGQALSFGLIAEDVAQIDPDLITRDEEGNPQTVRYEAVNAMLLNEFLKEHKKVEAQEKTIAELRSTISRQEKRIDNFAARLKEQAARIDSVSTQLRLSRPAPEVVANP